MPLPCIVTESVIHRAVPAEIHAFVPAAVAGAFPLFLNVPEGKKLSAGVVEHAVHHHLDPGLMTQLYKTDKAVIASQAPVHQLRWQRATNSLKSQLSPRRRSTSL